MQNLKKIVNALSKKMRLEVLKRLADKSMRNIEISKKLNMRKERVSESVKDLVQNRLAVTFEKGAITGEKHSFYVGTPLAKDVMDLDKRAEKMRELLPKSIENFGEGIGYLLKYYFETDVNVKYSTIATKKGRKVKLNIERENCGTGECDIVCEPIIKAVVNKFGKIEDFSREGCRFQVNFWHPA